jgi:hypothetical protein
MRLGIITFAAIALLVGCANNPSARSLKPSLPQISDEELQQVVKRIQVGMRRAEAEEILSSLRSSRLRNAAIYHGDETFGSGGAQVVGYVVDKDRVVMIQFDYTDVPRDSSGKATSYYSPENKVTAPATVKKNNLIFFPDK